MDYMERMNAPAQIIEPVLTVELRFHLCEAVRNGEMERNHRTRGGYPVNYAGQAAYAERVRYLHARLTEAGWARSDTDQQPAFTSACGGYRILTMAGDNETGRLGGAGPRTRPKGPRTEAAVQRNEAILDRQVRLFPEDDDAPTHPDPVTLFLVVKRDQEADRVRAELSIATQMTCHSAYVSYAWAVRELLLDEPVGDSPGTSGPTPATDPETPDIDFDIEEI